MLIDALPVTTIKLDHLPEELARTLCEALRLKIHYNRETTGQPGPILVVHPTRQ